VEVSGCIMLSNGCNGLYLSSCTGAGIVVNLESSNNGGSGIYLDSSSGNSLSNNSCSNNVYFGICIDSCSDNNKLWNNTLSHNNDDTTGPACIITSPTSSPQYTTGAMTISLGGTAYDVSGLATVGWMNMATGTSGTATGSTGWSVTGIALTSGWNLIFVNATDVVGNTYSASIFVYRDTTNPTCTITSPTSVSTYFTNWGQIKLIGTATDNIAATSVTWANDRGGSETTYMTPQYGGPSVSWQSRGNILLFSGVNVITVTVHDSAGNNATDILTVTYDLTAPTCLITSPTSSSQYTTGATTVDLAGTAYDASGIASVVWKNVATGDSGATSGMESWSIDDIALVPGWNLILVNATDNAGNTYTAGIFVRLDATPPTCTITTPTSSPTYYANWMYIYLGGTASDNIGLTSVTWANDRGGSGTASGTTSWTAQSRVLLYLGTNVITATAHDAVGNTGTDTITVIYDTTIPTCVITSPTSSSQYTTGATTVNLAGTATDSSGIASVAWHNVATGASGTATITTGWSATGIALNPGWNLIFANATDMAGNRYYDGICVYSDPSGPTATITAPTANPTMTTNWHYVILRGTASDNNKVTTVTWSNALTGDSGTMYMTPQSGGPYVIWQTSGRIHLLPGVNVITVTAYASAGYSMTDVLTVTYTGL